MNDVPDKPPPFEIELEPLPLAGDDEVANSSQWHPVESDHAINHPPVPDRVPHLCPDCGYDLRTLRSRVCPECGAPFSLAEARAAARAEAPLDKEDRNAIIVDRVCFYGGIGMYFVFIFLPMIVKGSFNWGLFMSGIAIIQLCGATIYKVTFDRNWPEALFLSGFLFAIFSSAAMLLL